MVFNLAIVIFQFFFIKYNPKETECDTKNLISRLHLINNFYFTYTHRVF